MNTPVLNQCQTATSSWNPTKGPYNIIVVSAAKPCDEPLQDLGNTDKTSIKWTVTIPAQTVVEVSVADAIGNEVWSGEITVGPSSDSSCLTAPSNVAGTGTGSTPDEVTGSTPGGSGPDSTYGTTTGSSSPDSTTTGSDASDPGPTVVPLGAANAGTNALFNSAASGRQASTPIMALSAIAAIALLAL